MAVLRSRAAGALSGALSVVLVFIGGALVARTNGPGRHSFDSTTDEVAQYVRDADAARVWVGEYIGALGFALFLPFAMYLLARVAPGDRDAPEWGERTGRAAAAIYVALSLGAIAASFRR